MIKASQIVQACVDMYDDEKRDQWLHYWETNNVHIGHKKIDDFDLFIPRGTQELEDFVRDVVALPVWHSQLGFCHGGFLIGIDEAFEEIKSVAGGRNILGGHSLGGARARLLAGLFVCNGVPYDSLIVCGSPKAGMENHKRLIEKYGRPHLSFRNRNDIVTEVPWTWPPIFDFVHSEEYISVSAAPTDTSFEALRDHSAELYARAVLDWEAAQKTGD